MSLQNLLLIPAGLPKYLLLLLHLNLVVQSLPTTGKTIEILAFGSSHSLGSLYDVNTGKFLPPSTNIFQTPALATPFTISTPTSPQSNLNIKRLFYWPDNLYSLMDIPTYMKIMTGQLSKEEMNGSPGFLRHFPSATEFSNCSNILLDDILVWWKLYPHQKTFLNYTEPDLKPLVNSIYFEKENSGFTHVVTGVTNGRGLSAILKINPQLRHSSNLLMDNQRDWIDNIDDSVINSIHIYNEGVELSAADQDAGNLSWTRVGEIMSQFGSQENRKVGNRESSSDKPLYYILTPLSKFLAGVNQNEEASKTTPPDLNVPVRFDRSLARISRNFNLIAFNSREICGVEKILQDWNQNFDVGASIEKTLEQKSRLGELVSNFTQNIQSETVREILNDSEDPGREDDGQGTEREKLRIEIEKWRGIFLSTLHQDKEWEWTVDLAGKIFGLKRLGVLYLGNGSSEEMLQNSVGYTEYTLESVYVFLFKPELMGDTGIFEKFESLHHPPSFTHMEAKAVNKETGDKYFIVDCQYDFGVCRNFSLPTIVEATPMGGVHDDGWGRRRGVGFNRFNVSERIWRKLVRKDLSDKIKEEVNREVGGEIQRLELEGERLRREVEGLRVMLNHLLRTSMNGTV